MMSTLDVVICTKNRPNQLIEATQRAHDNIKPKKLFIYDGSDKQNTITQFLIKEHLHAQIFDVRGLTFGEIRNLAIKNSNADYVAQIDDDIIYSKNWIKQILEGFKEKNVVAVNGRLILGNRGTVIHKISVNAMRDSGGSGGACVYDRKKIIELGNFDKHLHRGEDMELKLRIESKGYKWRTQTNAVAYHPINSLPEFFKRAKMDAVAWEYILNHSKHRTRFFVERFMSLLVMPIYYFYRTLDVRAWGLWFFFRANGIFSYLTKSYEEWK